MIRLRLTAGAETDLEETLDWYREKDPAAANSLMAALESTYRAIIASPTRYPTLPGGYRYRIVERYPISVIYHIAGDEIEVVAVAHAKRKPGYWRRRNGKP